MSALQPSLVEVPGLKGQVAIVTGASRGIGKAIALRLAEAGATVVVAAKSERSREQLPGSIHQTVQEIEAAGGRARAVRVDLRDDSQTTALIQDTLEEYGRLDLLVNNAGALWMKPVAETPLKRYDLVQSINARAPFLAASLCLEPMRAQGGGRILNISPPLELAMLPSKVAYCMSKFGQSLLSLGLAAELRGEPIAVASLWPATVVESQASINHGMGGPENWRKPEIVADAVLAWLALPVEQASGRIWLDEEVLAEQGVHNLDAYACVPGGQPIRIVGKGGWPELGQGSR